MRAIFLLAINLLIFQWGFSQNGKYKLGSIPPEALKKGDTLEFPVHIGTSFIRLKNGNKALYIHVTEQKEEIIFRGTWKKEGNLIILRLKVEANMETVEFEFSNFESGVYLMQMDTDKKYFKKVK